MQYYIALALALLTVVLIASGCADFRPRKVCTMEEWAVTSDCP